MLLGSKIDRGCDFWALGIIINKMLTGNYLFDEKNDLKTFESIKTGVY